MRKRAMAAAAAVMAGGTVLVAGSPSGAITEPVDIRVELDLPVCCPGGPLVLEVLDVTVGPGPELTDDDVVDNPSGWSGAMQVDIDPVTQRITISFDDFPDGSDTSNYETAVVTVTSSEIASASLVSDTLWVDPSDMPITGPTVAGGVLTVSWDDISNETVDMDPAGSAVIAYELAAAPTAALTPSTVQAGSPVTVSGTLCPSGPIMATIAPEGGAPLVDDVEQTVADGAGDWSFDIPTTDLAAGDYTVAVRCVQADLQGFDYEVLGFTVTAAPVQPAPPAQPTPAAPTFTG